jgi:histone H3/H4
MKIVPLHLRACAVLLGLSALSMPAHAGPPLLCEPFDTADAPSLPWGAGWNTPSPAYGLDRLVADTQRLLAADTPVIARMETLRRAAIYASRDGAVLRDLSARLEARVAAATGASARALALFDAGYFRETLQDLLRLQRYDMPRTGRIDVAALRAQLAREDGSVRIAQAVALRPQDASLRFAAALVARADERADDAGRLTLEARQGLPGDALLARNIAQLAR